MYWYVLVCVSGGKESGAGPASAATRVYVRAHTDDARTQSTPRVSVRGALSCSQSNILITIVRTHPIARGARRTLVHRFGLHILLFLLHLLLHPLSSSYRLLIVGVLGLLCNEQRLLLGFNKVDEDKGSPSTTRSTFSSISPVPSFPILHSTIGTRGHCFDAHPCRSTLGRLFSSKLCRVGRHSPRRVSIADQEKT